MRFAIKNRIKILFLCGSQPGIEEVNSALDSAEYQIVAAKPNPGALRELLSADFAAVILDMRTTGRDVFEIAQEIRKNKHSGGLPILFIAPAPLETSQMIPGYELGGIIDFVSSPIQFLVLKYKVDTLTRIHQMDQNVKISEGRFQNLFEQAPIAIQIFSPNGRCLQINDSARKLWNLSQLAVDQLVREYNILKDSQLASKEVTDKIARAFDGEVSLIPPILYNPGGSSLHGRPRWVESLIYPVNDSKGRILEVVLMHHDVTEQTQAQEILKLLAECSTLLATSLDYRASLEQISQLSVKKFGGFCFIHILDERGRLTEAIAQPNDRDSFSCCGNEELASSIGLKVSVQVIHTKKSILASDLSSCTVIRSKPTLKSYMSVPLIASGEIIGTLTSLSILKIFTHLDVRLLEELAGRAAMAIQSARLFEDARKAINARDEFLSIASHELKTPLTPLNIQIQSLQRLAKRGVLKSLPTEKLVQMFKSSAHQLQQFASLIDGMLDVSKIAMGKLNLETEVVDLSKLMQETVLRYSDQISRAQCKLNVRIAPDIIGCFDRERMEEVIGNLLTNAVKYGSGKPIHVEAKLYEDHTLIRVTDFGIGISEDDQKRIFDRFERAVSVYRFGGLGLGLYLAREIVEAHGGNIQVESQVNSGATFTVILPLRKNNQRKEEIASS